VSGEEQKSGLAVYTSVFGRYGRVWPPLHPDPLTRYLLVSDAGEDVPGWELVPVDSRLFDSARLANRCQKMLFHTHLSSVRASVYIDANVRPVAPLGPLFSAFIASGADLGMYRHYARSTVRDESRASVARKKVQDLGALDEEIGFYAAQGFPDSGGMWEGSVIFKNHDSPKVLGAMEEWWALYSRFRTRDQFSLPFVIWKHGLQVFDLDGVTPPREHFFVRLQASSAGLSNRLARYAQARERENATWGQIYRLGKSLGRLGRRP
jgi:hypothetical protein